MSIFTSLIVDFHHIYYFDCKKSKISIRYEKYDDIAIVVNYVYENMCYPLKYEMDIAMCNISQPSSTILNNHLYRIIKTKFGNKIEICKMADIIKFIIDTIPNICKICTICGNALNYPSTSINACVSQNCVDMFNMYVTDNCVKQTFEQDKQVFDFLITTGFVVATAQRKGVIFNPFPNMFGYMNFAKVESIIPAQILNNDVEFLYKKLNDSPTDLSLYSKIGQDLYGFIKFLIRTNNTILKSSSLSDVSIDCTINTKQKHRNNKNNNIVIAKESSNCTILEVIHNPEIEMKFKTDNPSYLFHGSNISNWYSILRNGLKNASGTALQVNGAAYGSGIYLTSNYGMSFGYSHMVHNNSMSNIKVVGVAQVLNMEKYSKGNTIYVVPNEDEVLLKFLVIHRTNSYNIPHSLSTYFTQTIIKENQLINKKLNNLTCKRLTAEYSNIVKNTYLSQLFKIDLENDDLSKWIITLYNMNNCGLNNMKIGMYFNDQYPLDSPLVHIITPMIVPSEYVVENGVICIQILSPKNWYPTVNIECLIILIRCLINDSNIKQSDNIGTYDSSLARKTFNELITKYKWNL